MCGFFEKDSVDAPFIGLGVNVDGRRVALVLNGHRLKPGAMRHFVLLCLLVGALAAGDDAWEKALLATEAKMDMQALGGAAGTEQPADDASTKSLNMGPVHAAHHGGPIARIDAELKDVTARLRSHQWRTTDPDEAALPLPESDGTAAKLRSEMEAKLQGADGGHTRPRYKTVSELGADIEASMRADLQAAGAANEDPTSAKILAEMNARLKVRLSMTASLLLLSHVVQASQHHLADDRTQSSSQDEATKVPVDTSAKVATTKKPKVTPPPVAKEPWSVRRPRLEALVGPVDTAGQQARAVVAIAKSFVSNNSLALAKIEKILGASPQLDSADFDASLAALKKVRVALFTLVPGNYCVDSVLRCSSLPRRGDCLLISLLAELDDLRVEAWAHAITTAKAELEEALQVATHLRHLRPTGSPSSAARYLASTRARQDVARVTEHLQRMFRPWLSKLGLLLFHVDDAVRPLRRTLAHMTRWLSEAMGAAEVSVGEAAHALMDGPLAAIAHLEKRIGQVKGEVAALVADGDLAGAGRKRLNVLEPLKRRLYAGRDVLARIKEEYRVTLVAGLRRRGRLQAANNLKRQINKLVDHEVRAEDMVNLRFDPPSPTT